MVSGKLDMKVWLDRQQDIMDALVRGIKEGRITSADVINYWGAEIIDLHKILRKIEVESLNQELKTSKDSIFKD